LKADAFLRNARSLLDFSRIDVEAEGSNLNADSYTEDSKIDSDTLKIARAIAGLKDEALKKRLKTMLSTLSAA
jgi:hypothetical protein